MIEKISRTTITLAVILALLVMPLSGIFIAQTTHNHIRGVAITSLSNTRSNLEWLVLVYDDGDNSLTDFISEDIKEMTAGGSTDTFKMLVLADFGYERRDLFTLLQSNATRTDNFTEEYERLALLNNKPSRLYEVRQNSLYEYSIPDELGLETEVNMGDPNTLSTFIKWATNKYKAKYTMLILADHGLSFRGFMQDEYSDDVMTPQELRTALQTVNYHFSIIGFDACLMASFSMLYEVAPYTDYIIASELTEPAKGWDYTVFKSLHDNPTITPLEFAKIIVNAYHSQYLSPARDHTLAVFSSQKLITAVYYFNDFINSLLPIAPKFNGLLKSIYNPNTLYYIPEVYAYTNFIDIVSFIEKLEGYIDTFEITLPPLTISISDLKSILQQSIIHSYYVSTTNPSVKSFILYIPSSYIMPKEFLNTRFAQYTQWNEFIFASLVSNRPYTVSKPQPPNLYIKNNTLYIELPETIQYQKYTVSGIDTGNPIHSLVVNLNGIEEAGGYYNFTSVRVLAYTYDGTLFSPLIDAKYDNIEGVYVQTPPVKITHHITKGWNTIAFPIKNINLTAKDLITAYYGIDVVVYKDTATNTYIAYSKSMPDSANFKIEPEKAYYVHATSDVIIEFSGVPISNVAITLYKGWNLVSAIKDMKASEIASKMSSEHIVIYDTNNGKIFYNEDMNTDYIINRGDAIWIFTEKEETIVL